MSTEFKLTIEVTLRASRGSSLGHMRIADAVCAAVGELVARRDFREGTIKPGRVIEHDYPHVGAVAVVDLTRMHVPSLGEEA